MTDETIAAPGSRVGFGDNTGQSDPSSRGSGTTSRPGGNAIDRRGTGTTTGDAKFDVNARAPIPSMPRVLSKGDSVHRGVLTFEIELPPVQTAPVPQEDPQQ